MRHLLFILLLWTTPAWTAPEMYRLQPDDSAIGFTYSLAGVETRGRMGVGRTDIALDFDRVEDSRVDVTIELGRAQAGIVLATEAMKSAQVLDVANHPTARFVSRRVVRQGTGAKVSGDLTLRGVTRAVDLDVAFFRQQGTQAGDLSRVTLLITGRVDRHDFGASGYPDLVGPYVDLRIVVRLSRV